MDVENAWLEIQWVVEHFQYFVEVVCDNLMVMRAENVTYEFSVCFHCNVLAF